MTNYARPLLSFTGAFSFLLCSFISPALAEDDSLQKVVDAGVLRVAAEPGTPPMLFKEGSRYDGFDYAIAKAVAKRIGVDDVIIVAGKYSELPARLIAGKADVIISGYTADDSITGIDWSEAYLDYGLCLVVKKGRGIRSTDDLRGKVIGIVARFGEIAGVDGCITLPRGHRTLHRGQRTGLRSPHRAHHATAVAFDHHGAGRLRARRDFVRFVT